MKRDCLQALSAKTIKYFQIIRFVQDGSKLHNWLCRNATTSLMRPKLTLKYQASTKTRLRKLKLLIAQEFYDVARPN